MMENSGNIFYVSGVRIKDDINAYFQVGASVLPNGLKDNLRMSMIDEEHGEKEHGWIWVAGESINGIHVRMLDSPSPEEPQVSLHIPWMASGMDIYIAYGIMNAIRERNPEAVFTGGDSKGDFSRDLVGLSDQDRDDVIVSRLEIIAMLLKIPEKMVKIPTIAGMWGMDIEKYRSSGLPHKEQVVKVLYDIIDYVWYQEHPEIEDGQE